MSWEPYQTEQLQSAIDRFDRPLIERYCNQLVSSLRTLEGSISETDGLQVLALLQRKRYFQLLQEVSDAMIQ
ncbi:MAG TPA: hypothetical protein VM754_12525, partial [Actinomycetota bacterium]|nr:hypothetical protein [Actinomycetota bacterium]